MRVDTAVQRICVWCAAPFVLLFFAGLVLAGWLPPPSPADRAAETARHYAEHRNGIRTGSLMIMIAGTLMVPFAVVIAIQIWRIGCRHHPLALLQLAAGAVVAVTFLVPTYFWMTAAFYSDIDPGLLRILNAAGWLPFLAAVPPAILQFLSIAVAAFTDHRAEPVFPRWIGYYNVWIALLFLPALFVVYFHDGPFAWNGALTFWLAAPVFMVWLVLMVVVLLRAIDREDAEEDAPDPPPRVDAQPTYLI
jgi:hypothetical protein